MRREVEGDVAIAAPSIFDACAFELRKHFSMSLVRTALAMRRASCIHSLSSPPKSRRPSALRR